MITTSILATDTMLTQFVENLDQINRGRTYFASPDNLGEVILADYIRTGGGCGKDARNKKSALSSPIFAQSVCKQVKG